MELAAAAGDRISGVKHIPAQDGVRRSTAAARVETKDSGVSEFRANPTIRVRCEVIGESGRHPLDQLGEYRWERHGCISHSIPGF